MKPTLQWLNDTFEKCMTLPDYNSRLVFLLGGLASTVSIIGLVIAFIFVHDKTGYDYMVMAISGGAVGHGFSRYLTKKNGVDADVPDSK